MNSEITIRQNIENALKNFNNQPLREAATTFLNTLGYYSKRVGNDAIDKERFDRLFESALDTANPSDKLRIDEWQSFLQIMQVSDAEINQQIEPEQGVLFESTQIDDTLRTSYMFVTVQLTQNTYTRTQLADITRFINKAFEKSIMVMFRYGTVLSLAIINRRPNLRNTTKQVLEKVTLIKDINLDSPKRAHIDIISELHLRSLIEIEDVTNFDTLHKAWEAVLNTEALNKQFYRKLFAWYEWTVKEATFPTDENRVVKPEEHVIRLITRLLFIWFIKEKGLVADALFNKAQIQDLLKENDFDNGNSYYRAVLQNLFFATLNTEIDKRKFSTVGYATNRDFSRYRYKEQMRDPDKLLEMFGETPFINGGLFDCLDSWEATGEKSYRIDCFSDKQYKKLSIPNRLFFDTQQGLIPLLEHYKFTVEENTPIEQEVALDPELLGRVFENLLAAYNPETGATVRKQTGSYYTPRAIVDYMVEEALVATLSQKCDPTDGDAKLWNERLHYLLDYAQAFDDANEWFDDAETDGIVRAISELKVLDPAVGSGAFPMGMLHKLTLALRRLDPDNTRWEQLQKERAIQRAEAAFDTQDDEARREELVEIDETFKRYRDSDFGRKLYLIQNSIFGIDIQPVACQIAKLRFFISLAIEQAPEQHAANFGIKPLPNLETRFIAANTLIGLKAQGTLTSNTAQDLEKALRDNREQHFHATTRQRKRACKIKDEELRAELTTELKHFGMPADDAERIARWDPYDQNATTDWFDSEWMFGLTDGFDVVIGNPPYVESRNSLLSDEQKIAYGKQVVSDWKDDLPRGSDLLIYFYARSAKFLNESGNGCFITQNAWLNTDYGFKFQQFSLNKFSFLKIIDSSSKFFSDNKSQNINTIITLFVRESVEDIEYGVVDANLIISDKKVIKSSQLMKWGHIFSMPEFYREILARMRSEARKNVSEKISFGQGLNFPLSQLSADNSDLPIIVKSAQFIATSADKRIKPALASKRMEKIPALVMPRGVGSRHYCTFNSCRAFSYSHVELYLPEDLWNSDRHYCLWVYLNSSFVWLFREITGRKNLGGGLLKAEATDMKMLPIDFNFDFAHEAKQVFENLKNREPMPVLKEIDTDEHLFIDDIVANYFGFQDRLEDIRNALVEQVNFRLTRARSKK